MINALWLAFWLILCGTLQVLIPAWRHCGHPAFPFLLGAVLYVAFNKKPAYFFAAVLLAAVLEDSLSLAPLGCSALAFFAASAVALLFRESFHIDKVRSVVVIGALCAAVSTGVMALVLLLKGFTLPPAPVVFRRMGGAAILAACLFPPLFWAMRALEQVLGIWEDRD